MAVKPHTIDIVVADMGRALAFYRMLGLDASRDDDGRGQTQVYTPGGTTLGLVTEELVRQADPHWVTPVGQRVTFSCLCDSPSEVDSTYARVTGAGYTGLKDPWDAFWGQRYAFLQTRTAIESTSLRRSPSRAKNDSRRMRRVAREESNGCDHVAAEEMRISARTMANSAATGPVVSRR